MLRNYLVAALRNLLRDRAYAVLNILGLALGFTAAILIGLFVRHEYSYDRFWPRHEQTYMVMETIGVPDRAPLYALSTFPHIAAALKLDFPQVEAVTRLAWENLRFRRGDIEGSVENAYWADPNFFQMFPAKAVSGNLEGALDHPDNIVLTRRAARQFFGEDAAAGQDIELNRAHVMHVAAVIEDLPSNTHMNGDVFLSGLSSFSRLSEMEDAQKTSGPAAAGENTVTYIRLRLGSKVADIDAGMAQFVKSHLPGEFGGIALASVYRFSLIPIEDLHLLPIRAASLMKPSGDANTLRAMIGVALLVLVVAGGNFVSMMTARAARRAVEIGVRKSVGATRGQIAVQFLYECLFYAGLSAVFAIAVVELILPAFNSFLQRDITLNLVQDPALGAGVVALAVVFGVVAGIYPALILSLFRPSAVLKGKTVLAGGSPRLRQALVIFQFATLIALIAVTMTIHRQIAYAMDERLRLPGEQIYISRSGCTPAFADQARQVTGVRKVACVADSAISFGHTGALFTAENGNAVIFRGAPVDYGFFNLFNISPLAGRLLAADHGEDDLLRANPASTANPAIVINETAAKVLGFKTPADAIGKSPLWSRAIHKGDQILVGEKAQSQIVGVIPDFSLGSVRDAIEPAVYFVDPFWFNMAVVQMDGGAMSETLRSLQDLWNKQGKTAQFEGTFLNQRTNALYADIRQQSTIFSVFTSVAVAIAALGLLGLAIFAADRRTKEMGLRKVMGAHRGDILKMLGWQFTKPVLWAAAIAWPCAYVLMRRWLEGFAYHINPSPLTFLGAGALALVIALATVGGHALMVARVQPVRALRDE